MDALPNPTVHPAAHALGGVVPIYERGRPAYPTSIVRHILDQIDERATVVDVGAGTGKLARALAPYRRVVAVDPLPTMMQALRTSAPGVPAVVGTAECLPLAGHSVDALTAAQAFHWFEPNSAAHEFHRVLRPGGALFLLWNERRHREPPHPQVNELLAPYRAAAPSYRSGKWRTPFDNAASAFEPLDLIRLRWSRREDLATFRSRFLSVSVVAAQRPEVRRGIDDRLGQIFSAVAGVADRINVPYETHLYWTRRRD